MIFGRNRSNKQKSITKVIIYHKTHSFESSVFANFIANIYTFSVSPKCPDSDACWKTRSKLDLFLLLISNIKELWCLLHLLGGKEDKKHISSTHPTPHLQLFFTTKNHPLDGGGGFFEMDLLFGEK